MTGQLFIQKLRCRWLKGLRQRYIVVAIQAPRLPSLWVLLRFKKCLILPVSFRATTLTLGNYMVAPVPVKQSSVRHGPFPVDAILTFCNQYGMVILLSIMVLICFGKSYWLSIAMHFCQFCIHASYIGLSYYWCFLGPWMNHVPPVWWSKFSFMLLNYSWCLN